MDRLLLAGLIALSGCNQYSVGAPESSDSMASVSAVPEPGPKPIQYCEFSLGEAIPAGTSFTSKEVVPTEGEERVFYTYKACDGNKLIKVELVENVIDSIELSGNGSCIESLACVGDTFKKTSDNHPTSILSLSQVEGATFALLLGNNVTARFDPNGIPRSCYDAPITCEKAMHDSKVIALLLHRSPN